MMAQTILRNIRAEREARFKKDLFLTRATITKEEHKEILIIDPPFEIDIVSLMKKWREKYQIEQEKKYIPFNTVFEAWVNNGKDFDEQKNRKSCINALISKNILIASEIDSEMRLCHFIENNSKQTIDTLISNTASYSDHTKKTYRSWYGSLWRFIHRFIYGPSPRFIKRKPLKREIRPLTLSEAAQIFDNLEKKALKSTIAMRDLLIMRLIMYGGEGVEIKSILSLNREHVNFSDNTISIRYRRKGSSSNRGKKRVECSFRFMKLLKSYLGPRKEELFSNQDEPVMQDHINKRLLKLCEELNISNVTLKSIQRSLIDILKRSGLMH